MNTTILLPKVGMDESTINWGTAKTVADIDPRGGGKIMSMGLG
jgi:hypothetical protein